MPDMDGTEVLYHIRKKEKNIPKEKRVKVIMVTSHKDKGSIITSVQAGCDDYVTKPFDKETLVAKLDKMGVKYFRSNKDTPAEMKEADANKIIKEFSDSGLQILRGRYGPYITDGKKNARVPKDREPESLEREECEQLLAAAPPPRSRGKKKTAAKRKTTGKTAPKRKTTTKRKTATKRRARAKVNGHAVAAKRAKRPATKRARR